MSSGDEEEGGAGGWGEREGGRLSSATAAQALEASPQGPARDAPLPAPAPAKSHTPESPSPVPSAHAAAPHDCQIAAPWMELL